VITEIAQLHLRRPALKSSSFYRPLTPLILAFFERGVSKLRRSRLGTRADDKVYLWLKTRLHQRSQGRNLRALSIKFPFLISVLKSRQDMMDEKEFVSLHDSGDRTIIVGEKEAGQCLYKVSSLAMSMASPVWRAMFNPVSGFRESNPDVPVEFPEDDPDVLLILLRIAHLQFHHLPKSISFAWLMELAVLCDKYDTVHLVQPFIENWMSPWTLLCLEAGYEDWLFIAWTFRCQKIFSLLAASLVLSIEVGSDDNILNPGNEVLGDHMPPQIIGKYSIFCDIFLEPLRFNHVVFAALRFYIYQLSKRMNSCANI